MTEGEKMVWAAVFAKHYNFDYPPHVARMGDRGEWERQMVASAVESAYGAVFYLHESRQQVIDGWGKSSDVAQMLDEMIGPPQ